MAETVYKKISELPNATLPLAGTEYVELSATGASKKGLWSGLFGSGWWAKLSAALSAFKAPDADHADNADTLGVGLETPTDFHDATQLVGAVPLANIPAELTGKNASTADLSDDSTLWSGISQSSNYIITEYTLSAQKTIEETGIITIRLYGGTSQSFSVVDVSSGKTIMNNSQAPGPLSITLKSNGSNIRVASVAYPAYVTVFKW